MGDVINGKKLFKKLCASCHTTEKDGKHKIGSNLHGIMGQICGSRYIKCFTNVLSKSESVKLTVDQRLYTDYQCINADFTDSLLKNIDNILNEK